MSEMVPTFDPAALQRAFTKPGLVTPYAMRHKHVFVAVTPEVKFGIISFVENEDRSMTIIGLQCLPTTFPYEGRRHLLSYLSDLRSHPLFSDCVIYVVIDCSYGAEGSNAVELIKHMFAGDSSVRASVQYTNLHTMKRGVENLQLHLKHSLVHFSATLMGGDDSEEAKKHLLTQLLAFRTVCVNDGSTRYTCAPVHAQHEDCLAFVLLLAMQLKDVPDQVIKAESDSLLLLEPPAAPAAPCAPVSAEAVDEAQ